MLTLLATWISSACVSEAATENHVRSPQREILARDSLIVLPGAVNIRHSKEYDGIVRYEVSEPFPAEKAINALHKNLAAAEWQPFHEDLFNPRGGAALREWGLVETNRTVYTWTGYWKDKADNLLLINLRYLVRRANGELIPSSRAEVEVIAFSKTRAEALRKALKVR